MVIYWAACHLKLLNDSGIFYKIAIILQYWWGFPEFLVCVFRIFMKIALCSSYIVFTFFSKKGQGGNNQKGHFN